MMAISWREEEARHSQTVRAAGDQKLRSDEEQDRGRDLEEFLKVDLTLPLTNITPKAIATMTPTLVPDEISSSLSSG